MQGFNRIAIFGRSRAQTDIAAVLQRLVAVLQRQQCQITCEIETAENLPTMDLSRVDIDQLGQDADLIIVVGGDGSLLRAAKSAVNYQTPIIGINKGRLGFLTDIRPDDIDTRLINVLNGECRIAERFFLQSDVHHEGHVTRCGLALNDVVLSPSHTPHMLEFEIFVNQEFICSHHADGLIVATPTGSTAYALSGGGPIIHPDINSLMILPMFSHTLSSRPIVVPGDSNIHIEFSKHNASAAHLRCSGDQTLLVPPGASLHIKKYAKHLQLVHPMDYNYYETLRSKLHWGKRL